jgi:hypothetical protein
MDAQLANGISGTQRIGTKQRGCRVCVKKDLITTYLILLTVLRVSIRRRLWHGTTSGWSCSAAGRKNVQTTE